MKSGLRFRMSKLQRLNSFVKNVYIEEILDDDNNKKETLRVVKNKVDATKNAVSKAVMQTTEDLNDYKQQVEDCKLNIGRTVKKKKILGRVPTTVYRNYEFDLPNI